MIIDIPEPPGVNIIDSRLKCHELGADLVTIRTREHQKFLMNKLFVDQVNISISYRHNLEPMGNFVHTAFKAYCGVLFGPV